MRHHIQLIFIFLVEMGFHHVRQAGLELLTSSDPSVSASQSAGIFSCEPLLPVDVDNLIIASECKLIQPLEN